MKRMRNLLPWLLGAALLTACIPGVFLRPVNAYTVYNRLEIEQMQLNKARIKTGSEDSGGKHVETYWQQDPLDSLDKLTDITFARAVFEAEAAGDYALQIHCKNDTGGDSITIRLYVNGQPYDVTVSGSSYQTVYQTVPMNAGKNTVILAWVNWGYFDYINYPSELKPVSQSTDVKYQAFESALNEVLLTPTAMFHNPDATLYTAPIVYDSGDEEWQGSATFTVNAAADINSVDLHYYVNEYHGRAAELAMKVNGGSEVKLDLSGTQTNKELVYPIPGKTLSDAGFKAGQENTIKFRQANPNGGSVGLYFIELKKNVVEEETTTARRADRYEAEAAHVIAGANIKGPESDEEHWSNNGYVADFTPGKITASSQIDEYCSNVGYLEFKVSAPEEGRYRLIVGYATEIESMPVYATSGYEWSKVTLTSTGSWNIVDEQTAYVYLKKGANSIWLTGPVAEKDWVNYDYIDVEYDSAAKIDTSKTVLFMDDGAKNSNSEVVKDKPAKGTDDTKKDGADKKADKKDKTGGENQTEKDGASGTAVQSDTGGALNDNSGISPQTGGDSGMGKYAAVTAVFGTAVILLALITFRRGRKKEGESQ